MKQLVQNLGSGETTFLEVPTPQCGAQQVLIATSRSLISSGTERMLVEFGRANWLEKARQQPEKVRQVLEKMQTDGIAATLDAVRTKLDEPLPLGYSNVGVVLKAGKEVRQFAVGDRVVSNGPHAEIVAVPATFCAKVPDDVPDDAAAFTVVAAIALQGLRLAQPTLGETFVVTGLGLLGLISVQLLRANGCRVLGVDFDSTKLALARTFGAETVDLSRGEDPVEVAMAFSRGRGVDGVILTLASNRDEPISQAARMCRKRGRIILVGVTGLKLNRSDFYEKEITFQVSCSYGPGRYDPNYENKGQDYPFGFVRWTAQRNFEAVLDMMAAGALDVEPLISHRFAFDEAPKAYDLLVQGREPHLGILLEYPNSASVDRRQVELTPATAVAPARQGITLGVIGAGNYAGRVLIPALKKTGAYLHTIVNTGSVTGVHYAHKYGFRVVSTDVFDVMRNDQIDAVVIATRHDSHAKLVSEALAAGKHVFCEKPLALTTAELHQIQDAWSAANRREPRILMVGFNRRFSPLVARAKALLASVREAKVFVVTVNAGTIPPEHWTQDPQIGGGRIIGEACHFIDLLRYLSGSPITGWSVTTLGRSAQVPIREDKAVITLSFEDGSLGTIHYVANGHRAFPKERIEVFCAGRVLQLDNFRALRSYGWPRFRQMRVWKQDKGHAACAQAFMDAVKQGGPAPIPIEELFEVSRLAIEIAEAARQQ